MHTFKKKFLRFLELTRRSSFEVFWWNVGKIARKFWTNLREIEKKILNDSRKIMETLSGKTEVIRDLCCCIKFKNNIISQVGPYSWNCWLHNGIKILYLGHYEEIREFFWNSFCEIRKKLQKNLTLEKFWKNVESTSQKL